MLPFSAVAALCRQTPLNKGPAVLSSSHCHDCSDAELEEPHCEVFAPSPSPESSEDEDLGLKRCSSSSNSSFKPLCPDFEHLMSRMPSAASMQLRADTPTSESSTSGALTRTSSPTNARKGAEKPPSIQLSVFQTALIHDASKRQSDQNLVPLPGYKKPPSLLPPCPNICHARSLGDRVRQGGGAEEKEDEEICKTRASFAGKLNKFVRQSGSFRHMSELLTTATDMRASAAAQDWNDVAVHGLRA